MSNNPMAGPRRQPDLPPALQQLRRLQSINPSQRIAEQAARDAVAAWRRTPITLTSAPESSSGAG